MAFFACAIMAVNASWMAHVPERFLADVVSDSERTAQVLPAHHEIQLKAV